ncbi:MAG: hypothetical protein AAGF33_12125 [Pseudomonadota bacterium]
MMFVFLLGLLGVFATVAKVLDRRADIRHERERVQRKLESIERRKSTGTPKPEVYKPRRSIRRR